LRGTRSRAATLWKEQTRIFLAYKLAMQDHAARLMQVEMGSRLLAKLRKRRNSAKGRGAGRGVDQGDGGGSAATASKPLGQRRDSVNASRDILSRTKSKNSEQLLAMSTRIV
jgi:hypothetical protein